MERRAKESRNMNLLVPKEERGSGYVYPKLGKGEKEVSGSDLTSIWDMAQKERWKGGSGNN